MPYIRSKTSGRITHVKDVRMRLEPHMEQECISDKDGKRLLRAQAMADCREAIDAAPLIRGEKRIYCLLRRVSASGMRRVIDLIVWSDTGPYSIAHLARDVLGWRYTNDKDRGLIVDGCGMDMGFHTVDALGMALGYRDESRGLGTLKHEWL